MMIALFIAFLPPLAAGYLLVTTLWPTPRHTIPDVLTRSFLAVGIGFGLSSCVFFIGLVVAGPTLLTAIVSDLILLAITGIGFALRRKSPQLRQAGAQPPVEPPWPGEKILPWVFLIVVVVAGAGFIYLSATEPHGQWDAWTIWNLKARFIYLGGDYWTNQFSTSDTIIHPDYPLLLPATIARLWLYAGSDLPLAQVGVSALYPAATLGLLVSGLWALKGRSQGLLGGVILASTHRFITQSSYQFADMPLSYTILAVLVLLTLWHERETAPRGLAVLAGIMAGLGTWTKNEGVLFLAVSAGVILLCWLVRSLRRLSRPIDYRQQMVMFLAGALPILALVIIYKITYTPPNDITAGQEWGITLARLTDLSRYRITAMAFLMEGLRESNNLGSVVFIVYLLLFGLRLRERKSAILMLVTIVALTLLSYFLIYIITPRDLEWHLLYSLDRLLMHLWPGMLFVFFLAARTPGELLQKL
jgi:4-amino-4-deoxy-L-arabinose transferase-like glycosyltransferase